MENSPLSSVDSTKLRESMARRLYRRSVVAGEITLPAVPGMIEYVKMCDTIFAAVGCPFTAEQLQYLRSVLEQQLAEVNSQIRDEERRLKLLRAELAYLEQPRRLERLAVTYLDLGRSLEGTARALFVHPNTVRYRLRRVADITGWDPADPREGFVLQVAITAGRLAAAPGRVTSSLPI